MTHAVFLSYATPDEHVAFEVAGLLERHDIRCWLAPHGVDPGDLWAGSIVGAIRDARVFLPLLSRDFVKSRHTCRELVLADSVGLALLPLRLDEAELDGAYLYFLCDRQWRDARQGGLAENVTALASIIRLVLSGRPDATLGLARPARAQIRPRIPGKVPGVQAKLARMPSRMIEACNALIPLVGREADLQWLMQLRDGEARLAWAVVKGEAGIGKTRLAIEFCHASAAAGWHAGFVSGSQLDAFLARPDAWEWHPVAPTLLVVDYAAVRADALGRLLGLLATAALPAGQPGMLSGEHRVRLLLLERDADKDDGWLRSILRGGEQELRYVVEDAFFGERRLGPPGMVGGISSRDASRRIVEATMAAWAGLTGKQPLVLPALRPEQWSRIQAVTTDRPLYLQLAAIHACETGNAYALYHVDRGELLAAAVERELRYIERECADGPTQAAIKYLTGVLCLTGLTVTHGPTWYDQVNETLRRIGCDRLVGRAVDEKRKLVFPTESADTDNSAIQPDILAAAFCWSVFAKENTGFKGGGWRAFEIGGANVCPKLLRLVQDLHGLKGFADVARYAASLLVERAEVAELEAVAGLIPPRSVSLRELALLVFDVLAKRWRGDAGRRKDLTGVLVRWCTVLAVQHQRLPQAVAVGQEAVALLSDMVIEDAGASTGLLARAHHYLALSHENLARAVDGDADRAAHLRAGAEHLDRAIALRRSLYARDAEAWALDLADSLNNKSNAYARSGDQVRALQCVEEALDLVAALPERVRADNRQHVARYHNVHGLRLSAQGRHAEALEAVGVAVKLRRELFHEDGDLHGEAFAISLVQAYDLSLKRGDDRDALSISGELLVCRQYLATRDPVRCGEAFLECTLVHPLLGAISGEPEDSQLVQERLRHLAAVLPARLEHQVTSSLVQIGLRRLPALVNAGLHEIASVALEVLGDIARRNEEAAEERRLVVEATIELMSGGIPDERLHDLAEQWVRSIEEDVGGEEASRRIVSACNGIPLHLWARGQREAARDFGRLIVEHHERLVATDPDPARLLDCTDARNNLAHFHCELGELDEAWTVAARAMDELEASDIHLPRRVQMQANLGDTGARILLRRGDVEAAVRWQGRAIEAFRAHQDDPDIGLGSFELVAGLVTLSEIECARGRPAQARAAVLEALEILDRMDDASLSRTGAARRVQMRADLAAAHRRFDGLSASLPGALVQRALDRLGPRKAAS